MQTYELLVSGRAVRANSNDTTLVRTSVGIDQVHVMFDDAEWLDFPLTITFSQVGVDPVTQSLTVSTLAGESTWKAEATVVVPYEVIGMVGPINVTIQGTDSQGRHIITAKGAPLSVEEAGDVAIGDIPADAPTVDQWHQAYADAMALINDLGSLKATLEDQMDDIVSAAEAAASASADAVVDRVLNEYAVPATKDTLGLVQVGSGLNVTSGGVISTVATNGITAAQSAQLANLAALAYYCFDTEFDASTGELIDTAKLKSSALQLPEIVDGATVKVDDNGKLAMAITIADDMGY